jgi:predicted dehydrogenase
LASHGLAQVLEPSVKTSRLFSSLEWSIAPVADLQSGYNEDMRPVMNALAEAGASYSKDQQPPKQFGSWLELLDQEKPEIALVNPPFHLLGTVVKECLLRGIHVLAEKPIAISSQELTEIRKLSETSQAPKIMAMLTMRYDPAFVTAQKFIAEGHLGRPLLVQVQKSYPLQGWDGKSRPAFYHKRATYGGTIPWVGIHAIDLFRWFLSAEFLQASASHSTLGNQGHGDLETMATLDFKLTNGALATAQLDLLKPNTPRSNPGSKSALWGDDRLRLIGEQGTLEIKSGRILIQRGNGSEYTLDTSPVTPMFLDFLDWVIDDKPMNLTTADCFAAAEAALLARDAADQGRNLNF